MPGGGDLTPQRFLQLGLHLGMSGGFEALHYLLEEAFVTGADGQALLNWNFLFHLEQMQNFDTNPIYTLLHDGLIHQRWFKYVPRRGYAKRLVQAHKLHHATIGKEGGVSFGFIIAMDPAWLKQELKKQREAGIAVVREAVD